MRCDSRQNRTVVLADFTEKVVSGRAPLFSSFFRLFYQIGKSFFPFLVFGYLVQIWTGYGQCTVLNKSDEQ